eukprot:10701832-Alexandrium_andersonii.AAC.1
MKDAESKFLKHKLGSLYMKRWEAVISFCRTLCEDNLLPVIRATWDAGRFIHGGGGQAHESSTFDPHVFTAVIHDRFFSAYLDLILALGD